MPSELHQRLVSAGERWLKRQGFAVVASELATTGCAEQADVIGFRSTCSALVEAKASRSDFLVDRKKPHRKEGGLGVYRFFISPPDVVAITDLPPGWGLLHLEGKRILVARGPTGNIWPAYGSTVGDWHTFQHAPDEAAERAVLYSIARRRSLPKSAESHEAQLRAAKARAGQLGRSLDAAKKKLREMEVQLFNEQRGDQALSHAPTSVIARARNCAAQVVAEQQRVLSELVSD
ncbi:MULTISPECIES: hypothetical protein [Achromobacter]|uniref:Uncharacterized protein n=1 Tax=Achromobacter mucicolens TaxID=1389922 RepID=A0ABM8LK82_9BURK|nr:MULTISPECIES: hypothetical protein [Achromobacter]CAB3845420.1 hypothetical protein LMG3410_01487 [Achromobacter aegrifaciens]CAB3914603.1 hypothetical protein LMG3415_05162 [Achromobacter mucicolens]